MALTIDDLVAEARTIQDEIDSLRKARRRRPVRDYTGRAVLLVQQRAREADLAELRKAARARHHRNLLTNR